MPDRDLFRQHIRHGWRLPVKRIFAPELSERAVELLVQTASRDLKQRGYPHIAEMAKVIDDALSSNLPVDLEVAVTRLDEICMAAGGMVDQIAARQAVSFLLPGATMRPQPNRLPEAIAEAFILDFIKSETFVSRMKAEWIESGVTSHEAYAHREHELMERLQQSPCVTALAHRILGGRRVAPIQQRRTPEKRPTLEDLVFVPLTAD